MRPERIPLTLALVGISVVAYLLMTWWNEAAVLHALLISVHANLGLPEIADGQVWRLLTPIFLHSSIFHVSFNMLWVYLLGGLIEFRQGSWTLLALVLVTAVVSNFIQYLVDGPYFGGMSGVDYALFGYVWIQGMTNAEFGLRLNPQIVYLMLGWFVVCWSGILELLFGLGVANTAHTAGLVSGMLLSVVVTLAFGRWRLAL